MELPGSEESNISAYLNKTSTLSGQPILNQKIIWKIFIFAHLNINSIRIKFDSLVIDKYWCFLNIRN